LSAEARRRQLVEAAAALALEQGVLPASADGLARAAGVSKALVYAYFPDLHDLYNLVVEREFDALDEAGLGEAAWAPDLASAAAACAEIYYRRVAEHGPLAHVVLRDMYMARRLRPDLARFRDRIARRLARLARRELRLPAREAVAALNLVITIPEEMGRLAWEGDLDRERGWALARQLIASSIEALRPA
jgi:AcrR family transcriptional regulator